jgi:two-component system sensor histidine kinase/response regulator
VLNDRLTAKVDELDRLNLRCEQLNEQLRSSELEYRLLFDANPLPMLVYERATLQVVAVNRALVSTYGYLRSELLVMAITDLLPPEDVDSLLVFLAVETPGVRSGSERDLAGHPWRHRYKDGTIVDVEVVTANMTLHEVDCRMALCQNVTERRRASADLAVARDQAVVASNAKAAFLANLSHEIRTPMNGVIGMNELLLDTELSHEQRAYAEQVARSSEAMLSLVNDMLDIANIESDTIDLDIDDFALRETIAQAGAVAALAARAKGVKLALEIDQRTPHIVSGDRRRFRQVLLNLVMNAVKFTDTGEVIIRVTATPATPGRGRWTAVRCEVADTGIGIDPGTLNHMFEPFTQADTSTTRRFGGTGVGLAIAKELTDLMGGAIGGESELGRGSTFWFELDLGAARFPHNW